GATVLEVVNRYQRVERQLLVGGRQLTRVEDLAVGRHAPGEAGAVPRGDAMLLGDRGRGGVASNGREGSCGGGGGQGPRTVRGPGGRGGAGGQGGPHEQRGCCEDGGGTTRAAR